jgi:acyl-CoA synthetase (AMP-forming)/AMP-acid ligase II
MSGNIIEIFRRNAALLPAKAAIIEGGRGVSYEALHRDVERVATLLRERGVRKEDAVLIFVPMSIELYTLLLATFHCGATAVFIDAWAGRARIDAACRMLPIRAFVGVPKAHLLRLVSREIRRIPVKLFANLAAWHPRSSVPIDPAVVDPDDAALVTFTTGSTGAPKAARRSHRFLMAQHAALVASLDSGADEIDMPLLPIFPLSNLASGATTVLPPVDPRSVEKFDPGAVLDLIVKETVVTTTGSPAFYARLADHLLAHPSRVATLRSIFLGGAPVFPRLAARLRAAFPSCAITVVYGATEAEPISMITVDDLLVAAERERHGLPVGRPVPFIDLRIMPIARGSIAPGGEEEFEAMALPPGEIGEICVAGEHVLGEYLGDPAAWLPNKIAVGDRLWHRTGDAGYLDAEGTLFLAGRVSQSFIHAGERIFVLPVEERLQGIEAIALGTIMEHEGALVVAVELREAIGVEELRAEIVRLGIPFDDVMILRPLPRDPRHHSKIDYARLRATIGRVRR